MSEPAYTTRRAYPELFSNRLWTDADDECLAEFTADVTTEKVAAIVDDGLTNWALNDHVRFRVFVDSPAETDGSVIVMPGEFAQGRYEPGGHLPSNGFRRALAVRALLNPAATLIVQMNNRIGEDNLCFTKREKLCLSEGDMSPYTDRLKSVVGHLEDVSVIGLSQGAVVASVFANDRDTQISGLTLLEAPNVVSRATKQLALDFVKSGKKLSDNLQVSGNERNSLLKDTASLVAYGARALSGVNRATVEAMKRNSAQGAIEAALSKRAGVAHAWSVTSLVSPSESNRRIRGMIAAGGDEPQYYPLELTSKFADHSVTNVYQVVASLARRARELKQA